MEVGDPLGSVEFAVMEAVHRGVLGARRTRDPAGEAIRREALRRCERGGLLRSQRDRSGRRYELTAAGRAKLRRDHGFRRALAATLLRSDAGNSVTIC